jgi:hypothetical protein
VSIKAVSSWDSVVIVVWFCGYLIGQKYKAFSMKIA